MSTVLAFIGLLTATASRELHAPLPPLEIPAEAPPAAAHRALEPLHPEFRERLERFFASAAAIGENPRILSGFRPLDRKRARRGRASWHAFGLAVDINLAEYGSMRTALQNMGRDATRWERLGRLAEAEGLIWGGRWRAEEVFHIEWHPGLPEGLNGRHLASLLAVAGPDGRDYRRTWPRFTGAHTPDDQVGKGKYWKGKKKRPHRRRPARSAR